MVSTYSRRSTAELFRIKSGLLSRVTEPNANVDRICAHLDAVERELQRRQAESIHLEPADNGYESVVRGGETLGYVRWAGKEWDGYQTYGLDMGCLGFWPARGEAMAAVARSYDGEPDCVWPLAA